LTVLIAILITGDLTKAFEIGVLDSTIKLLAHYIHDRLWFKVRWGTRLPTGQAAPEVVVVGQDQIHPNGSHQQPPLATPQGKAS
jgi:uncharacterized membrane protein